MYLKYKKASKYLFGAIFLLSSYGVFYSVNLNKEVQEKFNSKTLENKVISNLETQKNLCKGIFDASVITGLFSLAFGIKSLRD